MGMETLRSLAAVFHQIPDPRQPRGVRHPFAGVLALVFLGLLARIREMAVLQAWAERHWDELREPLGFVRERPPHATTISRVLAKFSVAEFQAAFAPWLLSVVQAEELTVVAVDGKTSRQSHEDSRAVQMLTVFAHHAKLTLAQWAIHAEKTGEPQVLLHHWDELLQQFPMLQLLTGDAIYCQRPLAAAIARSPCDYLLQVKKNQGDLHEALVTAFATADERPPAHETKKKRGPPRNSSRVVQPGRLRILPRATWVPRLPHRLACGPSGRDPGWATC